ncbi:MAG: L-seryl-tRNA(Sec) selenium transferase [Planctomycetota bacterium]|nr:MAG: L-seryl-tRNA(Sec) selenium transferase [Planctomycetota bacterium]
MEHPLRLLPSVNTLAGQLAPELPHSVRSHCARQAIGICREAILAGKSTPPHTGGDWAQAAYQEARRLAQGICALPLPPVINATGTVLHTGLGRAPLSQRAQAAAQGVLQGYCQLEFDLHSGQRGNRQDHVAPLLCALTGAEAALVVNNCAGATVLALQALAAGKNIPVSRGELVEIGGSFRVPEIMSCAGCILREVGSTNRTRVDDFLKAIDTDTAALMRVQQSNFRQIGFVEQVDTAALATLAHDHGLPLIVDQGSGCIRDLSELGCPTGTMQAELAAGADLVCGSGDKLLGGPQAGILLGRKDLIQRCAQHPMARALRCDKMSLAALAGTLQDYLVDDPLHSIPSLALLGQDPTLVHTRAITLQRQLGTGVVQSSRGAVGSGALPEEGPASWCVAIRGPVELIHQHLRHGEPAIVGRIHKGELLLDCLTLSDADIPMVAAAVTAAVRHCMET